MPNTFYTLIRSLLSSHFKNEISDPIEFDNRILLDYHLDNKNSTDIEYFTFLLALLPHTQPHFLTQTIQEFLPQGGDFPEIGGVKLEHFRGILPTLETLLFFLKPNNKEEFAEIYKLFSTDHYFHQQNILHLELMEKGAPLMAQKLVLSDDILNAILFLNQRFQLHQYEFPANELTTPQDWSDLILNPQTLELIHQIKLWIKHEKTIRAEWQMNKILPKGFKALFYGPPGTGKTLTASLLGKEFDRPVYRIDLSQTISKYIGETEKNLEKLFTKASTKNCILFFDEADALFGKRTQTSSSQDRFANQQTSYLLQSIEIHPGIVILASNLKNNIDNAFLRRFNMVVPFIKPNSNERAKIWNKMLPKNISIEDQNIMEQIISQYELTGAQIANVLTYVALQTVEEKSKFISSKHLLQGIKLEFQKEEKLFKDLKSI